ncbi:MAG TPA: 30S ribosomal protein S6 [Solirubrobacterales bacterium]|nr:30S ribosomal protein S6 [Solirubrobacterales bacterium]HMU26624.1 30S ribosomal protein S6 [Solirubrobacterales bacterium]HMW45084.1 30S ribosomal protein S6 [Solirubrobacterales bacterium]HMX70406.1 30S ribosomal protein S6 [Solirubrobacterales bacterium]HMY26520.1 30S ribosomal protein S6 [Solirubrobacterales bacterium]
MTDSSRQYELVLMLDPQVEEAAREKLVSETKSAIEANGSLKHEDNWGIREMAYEIDRKSEADYRLFRFDGERELLGTLDHSLKIADGVLRFRIFRVDPDAPVLPAPPATAVVMAPTGDDDERRGRGRYRDE